MGTERDALGAVIPTIRSRIAKYRGNRRFNEQNTKASLILPVLEALGWNTNDPEDVQWEYKPKPRHNPVDFALLLKRTPCLFLEAKALRESLTDDKLITQILWTQHVVPAIDCRPDVALGFPKGEWNRITH